MSKSHSLTNDITPVRQTVEGWYGFEWNSSSRTLARLHGCRELFQAILSQAGSHLLTGEFHDGPSLCIHKAEGGFLIPGRGEFIPTETSVAKDRHSYRATPEDCRKLTELLSRIVMNWNPARHEDSMYEVAADHVGVTAQQLRTAVEGHVAYRATIEMLDRGTRMAQPISYFFGWNTGTKIPYDEEYRDYWLRSSSTIPAMIREQRVR